MIIKFNMHARRLYTALMGQYNSEFFSFGHTKYYYTTITTCMHQIYLSSINLLQAAWEGRVDIVQQWLDALPPDKKMKVLMAKDCKEIKCLLQPDYVWEHTPLHAAAKYCHLDVAELLIQHGVGKVSFFTVAISLVPRHTPMLHEKE